MPDPARGLPFLVPALAAWLAAPAASAQLDRGDDAAVAPAARGAESQPVAGDEIDLARTAADLGSPDVKTRIEAHERLAAARSITLRQIEQLIRTTNPLSPEQRRRLLAVAYQRFLTEPRAGMGINANRDPDRPTLNSLIEGFPAAEVLKVGDRFIAAAGMNIDAWDTLRAVIISHDPGDEIPATIVRDGATLNVRIKLGRFDQLDRQPQLEPSIREAAWTLRSRGLRDPAMVEAKPIESGLSTAAWFNPALIQREAADIQPADVGGDTRTNVVAGGESRGGVPQVQEIITGGVRVLPRDGRGRPIRAGGIDAAQAEVVRQLQLVQIRKAQSMIQRDRLKQRLQEAPESERPAVQNQITKMEADIQAQDQEILRLLRLVR